MRTLLEYALKASQCDAPPFAKTFLKSFGRIIVFDSTEWSINPLLKGTFKGKGGDASEASCKLFLTYNQKTSKILDLTLCQGTDPEAKLFSSLLKLIRKKDLLIADLGYYSIDFFSKVKEAGAYFLSRLKNGTLLFDKEGKQINLVTLMKKYDSSNLCEYNILLSSKLLPCRLIASKLPEEQANRRIQRMRKDARGKKLSKERRFLARWNLLITNAPIKKLSTAQVPLSYRLRWNIELIFKQFKSTLGIHNSNHKNKFRLQVEIYACLIIVTISLFMHGALQYYSYCQSKSETSIDKFIKSLRAFLHSLLETLVNYQKPSIVKLKQFLLFAIKTCIKEHSNSKPTSFSQLKNAKLT